jgi:tripeptidyl-peptidase I
LTRSNQRTRYGAHLTKQEVEALIAPHSTSVALVDAWLSHHDIDLSRLDRSPAGDWIAVKLSVSNAERLLAAKYNVYRHVKTGVRVVRTLGFSLPRVLHDHIDLVTPTTYFGSSRSMSATHFLEPVQAPSINNDVTVGFLRELYGTTDYNPSADGRNTIGIAGYLQQYANHVDLQVRAVGSID